MRPMESDSDNFLTYYLTKDNNAAELFKESRADRRGIDSLQEEDEVGLYLFVFLPLIHTHTHTNRRPNSTLCATMKWSRSNKMCRLCSPLDTSNNYDHART